MAVCVSCVGGVPGGRVLAGLSPAPTLGGLPPPYPLPRSGALVSAWSYSPPPPPRRPH